MLKTAIRVRASALALLLLCGGSLHAQRNRSGAPVTGTRPITSWLIIGAFPVDTGAGRLTRPMLPNEPALAPAAGELGGTRRWIPARGDSLGRVDFNVLLPDQV